MRIELRETETGLAGNCPIPSHCGDANNPNAFTIDKDEGFWSCWTHGCHERYGRDIIGLVRTYYDCSFKEACDFIYAVLNDRNVDLLDIYQVDRLSEMMQTMRSSVVHPVEKDRTGELEYHTYLVRRGFSNDVIKKYETGYYEGGPRSCLRNRIIFPIRHIDGSLVGYTGRTLLESKEEMKRRGVGKWFHSRDLDRSENFSKSLLLYNAYNAKHHVKGGTIILVEGTLDVLKLEMAGIHNACAVFGHGLSRAQERLIRQMGARVIIPLFDSDKAGMDSRDKLMKRFPEGDLISVRIVELPNNQDPGDLSVDELKEILHDCV